MIARRGSYFLAAWFAANNLNRFADFAFILHCSRQLPQEELLRADSSPGANVFDNRPSTCRILAIEPSRRPLWIFWDPWTNSEVVGCGAGDALGVLDEICALSCIAVGSIAVASGFAGARAEDPIRDSVVRITVTQRTPNFRQPWTKSAPAEAAGTGFVIDGKRILTNAHVVAYATQIYVEPHRSADKIPAKVIVSAPAIDLALLSLEDATFFDSHQPVPFAEELPVVKSTVNVYGYPLGGEQMSVTEGIISRIKYGGYFLGTQGLRVQIDAALNPGNSGGPAVSGGKLIGVAFSGIPSAENIGYLIPTEEVRSFLADVQDGKYDGQPRLQDSLQGVQNSALRAKFGLAPGTGGVLVHRPFRTDGDYPLKFDDVITQIGDHALDAAGNVQVTPELQLPFLYYVPKLAQDGKVKLTVLRGGQSSLVDVPVKVEDHSLIASLSGGYPRYFIYGPMVFAPPSRELLSTLGEKGRHVVARTAQSVGLARIRRRGLSGRRTGDADGAAVHASDFQGLSVAGRRDTLGGEWRGDQESAAPGRTAARQPGRVSGIPLRRPIERDTDLSPGRAGGGNRRYPVGQQHPQAVLRRPDASLDGQPAGGCEISDQPEGKRG